jgi:hypothetical protein
VRFPLAWNHTGDIKWRRIKKLEQILIANAYQLFAEFALTAAQTKKPGAWPGSSRE